MNLAGRFARDLYNAWLDTMHPAKGAKRRLMNRLTRNRDKQASHARVEDAAQPGRAKNPADLPTETPQPTATGNASKHATSRRSAAQDRLLPSRESHANSRARRNRNAKAHKPNFVTRAVNHWCNRLLGAVSERSLADQQAEYASGRTKRDYLWNAVGVGSWGMVFPVLTIVVTQLVGVEQAGMFSFAFITALLLMFVGNYGVRTYQASDLDEEHSFSDYQVNRWITCALMIVIGVAYFNIRGYSNDMLTICMGVCVYKMIDALADVYEGRLQQVDKLYLAGISQAFRSVTVLFVFSAFLLITRNLPAACIAMGVVAAATFLFLTLPLALFESPRSHKASLGSIALLFKQCLPLFVALFMYNLIDNMPKFVMEGVLSYDNQLYFNALYFPAHGILLTAGFVYKPLTIRMAQAWSDHSKRRKFDLIVGIIFIMVVVLTLAMALVMGTVGLPVMSFLYGLDFEQFRGLCFIMLAAGGVTAAIEFLYQVVTVLRRQKSVMRLYVITFGFSLFVPVLLVNFTGLPGAVIGYLIVMTILLVLLLSDYIGIRMGFLKEDKAAAQAQREAEARQAQRVRPSEARAERERRQHVLEKRGAAHRIAPSDDALDLAGRGHREYPEDEF